MHSVKRTLVGLVCAGVAVVGVASAETQHYTGHHCVPKTGGSVDYGAYGIECDSTQYLFCPIVKMAGGSTYTTIDIVTSSGVSQSEVMLFESTWEGDLARSTPAESTATEGRGKRHHWANYTPLEGDNILVIRVQGQPNDDVYSYRLDDTGVDY